MVVVLWRRDGAVDGLGGLLVKPRKLGRDPGRGGLDIGPRPIVRRRRKAGPPRSPGRVHHGRRGEV